MVDPRKPLGLAIKKRRVQLAMTQEQLAEKADMHCTYVSGVERGIQNISIVKLAKIAAGLGVKVQDLTKGF